MIVYQTIFLLKQFLDVNTIGMEMFGNQSLNAELKKILIRIPVMLTMVSVSYLKEKIKIS